MTTATASNRSTAMSIAHSMLQEFEHELPTTRKFLERLPDDRLTWKPHEKSMTAGQLALHIAQCPHGPALKSGGAASSSSERLVPPSGAAGRLPPPRRREGAVELRPERG